MGTSVVDTGGKFAAESLTSATNLPKSLTPAANLPPVSTLMAKFATGVVDTGGKFAAGIVDTGGKFAIGIVDTGGKLATCINNTSETGGKICRRCR
jgi:hypothetical protein